MFKITKLRGFILVLILVVLIVGLIVMAGGSSEIELEEQRDGEETEEVDTKLGLTKRWIETSESEWEYNHEKGEIPENFSHNGEEISTEEFLAKTETEGIVVADKENIYYEGYYRGYDEETRFNVRSVTTSLLTIFLGMAKEEGKIELEDEITDHLGKLENTPYEGVTVENALANTSGLTYPPNARILNKPVGAIARNEKPYLEYFQDVRRIREPGEKIARQPAPGVILGELFQEITEDYFSYYIEENFWEPMGAESDAFWLIGVSGREVPYTFFHATLRDNVRIGRLFLTDGEAEGQQIIPPDWLEKITRPQKDKEMVVPPQKREEIVTFPDFYENTFYGYQWFIPRDGEEEEILPIVGNGGHYLYINIDREVVIVKTGFIPDYGEYYPETISLFRAISEEIDSN